MTVNVTAISGTPVGSASPTGRFGQRALRILLTSAGRRVELLRCFSAAAAHLGVDLQIFACDVSPDLSSACHQADRAFVVPRVDDPGYTDALLGICADHGIALVVPTIDPELLPLSLARSAFAAVGTHVAVSDPGVVEMARDKLATASFLSAHHIPSPRSMDLGEGGAIPADWPWPAIIKPRHGSGSRGLRISAGPDDLLDVVEEPMILQERLTGAEFTVNMFFARDGGLRCAIPHERLQVRAGEVEKGRTRRSAELGRIAARLGAALVGVRGALCFQAMLAPDGSAHVFEINARFGGGYPLAHHAGATFAKWLIEEQLGFPSSSNDDWRENVVMLRYDMAVFVEA